MTAVPSPPAAPTPVYVRFTPPAGASGGVSSPVDRYRVLSVTTIAGQPLSGIEPGGELLRIESTAQPPPGAGDLVGVTRHLGYQTAAERVELAPPAPPASGGFCVLIPISKSAAWWNLAQDERILAFRGRPPRGHVAVGRPYANRIFRKLYHGRYLPGAGWDFLTYFEFETEREAEFRALVAALRDPEQNPEWSYVEREAEVWMRRV